MLLIKSKYKVAKRLGAHIFPQTQTQKFALSEARSKKQKTHKRAGSDFNKQLLEKQRVRYTYGLSEKQLSNYVARATKDENPPQALHRMLELRLDSIAYRAGFAKTRRAARQLASHGHFTVNGRRMSIPSFKVSPEDVVAVREGKSRTSLVFSALASNEVEEVRPVPQWLAVDIPLMRATVSSFPEYTSGEGGLDYTLVFEYYSR